MAIVLDVKDLKIEFNAKRYRNKILDNVSFSVKKGECLGILGESGSGKSMTAKAILGLLDKSFEIEGSAFYNGKDLLSESKESLRNLRGKEIAMVLQNPMTCFDPLYRIGSQIAETFLAHKTLDAKEIYTKSVEIFDKMHIRDIDEVLEKYPHQLSGGMLQRIMIGLAMSMRPKLLIADEPTTAIDAITKFEILKEFKIIKEHHDTAMIFISHDLGAISTIADKVLVLNNGKIADEGTFEELLLHAQDPYTNLLIEKRKAVMDKYRAVLSKRR